MQYNKNPSIIHIDPARYATNVHVAAKITIGFDSDIDKTTIANNLHIYNSAGKPIEVRCACKNRVITVTPLEKLSSEETYRVVVHGDNNPMGDTHDGIQSIVGTYMLGDYEFVFTTKNQLDSLETVTDGYPDDIVINTQPEFKYNISKLTEAETAIIELQLSKSKVFDNIIWTGTGTPNGGTKGIKCGLYLTDAVYYWRARVVRAENKGTWSNTFQFSLNTMPRVSVVEDDTVPLDVNFPSDWEADTPIITAVFPNDSQAAVPVNTQIIAVVIQGIVPKENIDFDSLYITYESNIDFTNAKEGKIILNNDVIGDIDIVYNLYDNTTTIVFKLHPLPDSELLDYENTLAVHYSG